MKVQTLSENLIKALNGIKEPKVSICNVIVYRKPLLEALKINKKFDLITLESGKTTWNHLSEHNEILQDRDIVDKPCLRISLDHTVMTFFNQDTLDYKSLNPAKLDFTCSQDKQGIEVDTLEFITALTYALTCVATDQSRPNLACVLFDTDNDTLKLVGADGYRLGIAKMQVKGIPNGKVLLQGEDIGKKLLPFLKAIKPTTYRVGKTSRKEYPPFKMEILEHSVKFHTDSGFVELDRFNEAENSYPQYEQLIPTSESNNMEFCASDLLEASKAIAISARDGTGIIRLKISKMDEFVGKITLSAKSEEIGDSQTDIDAKIALTNDADYSQRIALNSKYLIDLLNQYKSERLIGKMTSASSPLVFESNNRQCVIMPMFVQW